VSNIHEEYRESGTVRISDEVVGVIAGLAALEIQGVAGMSGSGFAGSVVEMLGKRNLSKGVKVTVGDRQAAVELSIIVEYGVLIPVVARNVQENVRRAIESMTGLQVMEVNVHVQGVDFTDKVEENPKGK
jgi:uncharacterized alkaline shock family protein YloU